MSNIDARILAANLDENQRAIVTAGPQTFAEADAVPDGLFEHDVEWDPDDGDEYFLWEPTPLGREVRVILLGR